MEVTLYYQTTSKEYIEFLRDNNHTNTLGQELYDAWVAHGRARRWLVAQQSALLDVSGAPEDPAVPRITTLAQNYPNPFNPQTWIDFSLPRPRPSRCGSTTSAAAWCKTLVDGDAPRRRPPGAVGRQGQRRTQRGIRVSTTMC